MKYFFLVLFFIVTSPGIVYCQRTRTSKKAFLVNNNIKKSKITNDQPLTLIPDRPQDLPVTYTFSGNGNWNEAANWENNLMPPPTTNSGSEIIINNIPGGECLLNIPYSVTPGTSLSILSGKTLKLTTNLVIN